MFLLALPGCSGLTKLDYMRLFSRDGWQRPDRVIESLGLGPGDHVADIGSSRTVWIDTDPACGVSDTADVDDCWALLYALRSPELQIRGMSTVFGNAEGATTHAVAKRLVSESTTAQSPIPIFAGAERRSEEGRAPSTAASDAIFLALKRERLTVIALGPVTNIAAVIGLHPEVASRIEAVVAVAGTRPSQQRLYPSGSSWMHFHDLNFKKDAGAFQRVLVAGIPIVLLPFEAAQDVTISGEDLDRLKRSGRDGRYLAGISAGWLDFWKEWLRSTGFHPFDSLAVGWIVAPHYFECGKENVRIRRRRSLFVSRDILEVGVDSAGYEVRYCTHVKAGFKEHLIRRIAAPARLVGL